MKKIINSFANFANKITGKTNYDINNLGDITVSEEYSENAKSVETFKDVLGFICEDIHKSIRLTSSMKKELTEEFGKHIKTFRGEFFYYIWSFNFEGENFIIYTAKGKGSSFYINNCEYTDDKSEVIIRFLTKFDEILKEKTPN